MEAGYCGPLFIKGNVEVNAGTYIRPHTAIGRTQESCFPAGALSAPLLSHSNYGEQNIRVLEAKDFFYLLNPFNQGRADTAP